MAFELKKKNNIKNPLEKRPVLTTGITEDEDRLIKKACKELNLTRADFVRMCVADYFFKQEFEVGK